MRWIVACCGIVCFGAASAETWYDRAFFLLHEDHHTQGSREVGRDADEELTERLIMAAKPDSMQIHAKGNPGWTTYPSRIGHTPAGLKKDVLGMWRDIARRNKLPWSIYYNIGRDGEIMKRRPEWNRNNADGKEVERAICYHSGIAGEYIWPMLDEIMKGYDPDGFWFDGSVFTVAPCYCDACRKRFKKEQDAELPRKDGRKWPEFCEMQRQVYREFVSDTCKRIHSEKPDCLVTFNWAYSLRMPEKPDRGVAYLTGDIANRVEGLSAEAHWYDGVGLPFELMTTGHTFVKPEGRPVKKIAKPKPQIEQEMAVIIANGGRFNVWGSPTPESSISEDVYRAYAEIVSPFLRARREWCPDSRRLPDVSLVHASSAHYALADKAGGPFDKRNNRIEGACRFLSELHLNYEMVGDWRLHSRDIAGRLLVVEHPKKLSSADVLGMMHWVKRGGRMLMTGMGLGCSKRSPKDFSLKVAGDAVEPERYTIWEGGKNTGLALKHHLFPVECAGAEVLLEARDKIGKSYPFLTRAMYDEGQMFYVASPLLTEHGKLTPSIELVRKVMDLVIPPEDRLLLVDLPANIETGLRIRGSQWMVHLVNMAEGERTTVPRVGHYTPVTIHSLPEIPAGRVSLRSPAVPERVVMQPGGKELLWKSEGGRLVIETPPMAVHGVLVVEW